MLTILTSEAQLQHIYSKGCSSMQKTDGKPADRLNNSEGFLKNYLIFKKKCKKSLAIGEA